MTTGVAEAWTEVHRAYEQYYDAKRGGLADHTTAAAWSRYIKAKRLVEAAVRRDALEGTKRACAAL